MSRARGTVIALLGAESTGKTTLAAAVADALCRQGRCVARVGEYLREFCERQGRTPLRHEQRSIADEQTRRIQAAASVHEIVIADTSALMIAVYSDLVFGDTGLYADALKAHAHFDLTLLTALDLPWRADGLQRDGPHVREPVDDRVRAALDRSALPYAVICGTGAARLRAALASVRRQLGGEQETRRGAPDAGVNGGAESDPGSRWKWHCDRCDGGEGDCERHRP